MIIISLISEIYSLINGDYSLFNDISVYYGERPECRPSYMLSESKLLHHVISRKIERSRIKEKYLRPIKTFND